MWPLSAISGLKSLQSESCIIASIGHRSAIVMYAPAIRMNPDITKAQMASHWPNLFTNPSAFVDEKRTKYPMTAHTVAGKKLKKKHISSRSHRLHVFDSRVRIYSRQVFELDG